MRGISPKQEVPRDQWPIHLANKIKFHWRPLLSERRAGAGRPGAPPGCGCSACVPASQLCRHAATLAGGMLTPAASPPRPPAPTPAGGLHCPFKPDKYFESYTYARLPAPDRWGGGCGAPAGCGR